MSLLCRAAPAAEGSATVRGLQALPRALEPSPGMGRGLRRRGGRAPGEVLGDAALAVWRPGPARGPTSVGARRRTGHRLGALRFGPAKRCRLRARPTRFPGWGASRGGYDADAVRGRPDARRADRLRHPGRAGTRRAHGPIGVSLAPGRARPGAKPTANCHPDPPATIISVRN